MPGIRYLDGMPGGVPMVATPDEIDTNTADKLRVVLLEATSNGYPAVVVDMTRTRFCDCAGLGTSVRAHKRVLAEGSGLRLVIPADGIVPRILVLTGIDRFISCLASLEDALAQPSDGGGSPAGST